jgi:phenylpropionate dioxygenase-like ring-hydroxylating dioxygenase large terminal subunit
MLSHEDNETLVRVGPQTAMGNLIRRFWIPALLESELPARDGTPVRVRLMGEDLVAFRDTEGRIGLLEEQCPHRRASLALGANEECGLRCLFHGWKFDVTGQCVDTPTEPAGRLAKRMRAVAYPTRVSGGLIWAYMGPGEAMPPFPEFPWLNLPPAHMAPFKVMEDCNYAQAVEGTVDSAHAGVLHRVLPWSQEAKYTHEKDLQPRLEVELTKYGMRYGAIRSFDSEQSHARVTHVAFPFWTLIPPDGFGPRKNRRLSNAFVPRDDVSTWHFQCFFDETQPIDVAHRIEEGGHWLDKDFRKQLNRANWYQQDRSAMKTSSYSGLRGVITQDHAVCETQGAVLDRSREHLGSSDLAVVAWRRMMLKAARDLVEGKAPDEAVKFVDWTQVMSETLIYPKASSWKTVSPLSDSLKMAAAG